MNMVFYRKLKKFEFKQYGINPTFPLAKNIHTEEIHRFIDLLNSEFCEELSPQNAEEVRIGFEKILASMLLTIIPSHQNLFTPERLTYMLNTLRSRQKPMVLGVLYALPYVSE